jgi:hypothetical protein
MVAGRCDKWVVAVDKDGIIRSGVTSAPSKGDPVGGSGMERPGVYPVEVATVVNMRTVTGDGQVVLENPRGARLLRKYILLDMTSWLIMERDSVWRRGDGPEDNE